MLRDGAGDSLLSARTSGARRSMCGRDKGAFFGKADVNGIQNRDANTTVCAPRKNNSDATISAGSCRIAGKTGNYVQPPSTVAVGTTIADRPPHRSVRARLRIRLLPRMSSGKVCLPHTVRSLGHAFPALCRGHVRLNDVLLSLCPSLPGLRGRLPFLVRLVHGYYGTVRLLPYVHVRRSVCGLRGPVLIG